jgi:PAS domain S-box-containing protein
MKPNRPTYEELELRLAAAEPIVEALKRHEVDAVVGKEKIAVLLLREVGEELQNSDAAFRAVFDLPGVGMVQADTPALRFTKVNPKFCEMTGYSAQELLAKTYLELTYPQDRAAAMRQLARVLRGQADSWAMEIRCLRKDGAIVWVVINGAVLRDDAGRTRRIIAMIADITPRRQAQQTRRRQTAALRKLTAELAQLKKSVKKTRPHGRSP